MSEPVPAVADTASWMAAGVRHELLMRVLPSVRHDMAGPLSVARMGNTVLRRYLSADPFDADKSLKRLDQTDEQFNQLLAAIRSLSRWDTENGDRLDADAALAAGWAIGRPVLDLHGLVLEVPDVAAPAGWPPMHPGRALYGVLAALSYLQDTANGPAAISVHVEGDAVLLQATPRGEALPEDQRPAARPLRIDAALLACLAQDLEWPMVVTEGSVRLERPPAED